MKIIIVSNVCIFIIAFLIVKNCQAAFTYTNKCDESHLRGNVNWVNVSNCDPSLVDRCIFKKGTNVTIRTSFTANENVNSLKVKIFGSIMGLSVPWRINPDDACSYGVICPILNNTENTFSLTMPISHSYPNIPVTVKVRLEDSRRKPFYCMTFPAKIES